MDKITLGTKKVSIEFPGVKALSDCDFEISTGVIHAVMGANGAGKSTLMKVLAGSNPGYTGDVLYNGQPVRREASPPLRIIWPAQAPSATVTPKVRLGRSQA